MNNSAPVSASASSELVRVLDDCLARLQAGESLDKKALLDRYPELADDLEACLASLEFIKRTALDPAALADDASIGSMRNELLGDFRLGREIGRGGMGVVYEAEQVSLGRTVALKILPFAGALDEKQLQRFKNEARAAATLEHPHIVPVYSVGCERGVNYFAMRYIDGQSLAEFLKAIPAYRAGETQAGASPSARASHLAISMTNRSGDPASSDKDAEPGPPSAMLDTRPEVQALITTDAMFDGPAYLKNVARLGIQAAEALAYAHEQGILHRDIKPGNLLLDVHGDLWVADFGLARLEQEAGLTVTGDMLGTLRYMSPEQALGQRVLDERADVYSLGITLYEMLVLRPAFSGRDRQEILRRIATEEPKPPRQINPRIPRDLETIVLKAISKEPAGRYQEASQLADDLRQFLDSQPIHARRPKFLEKCVKWSRRHPAAVWATILVLFATTVISAVSAAFIINAFNNEAASRTQAEKNETKANASTQVARDNARRAIAIKVFLTDAFKSSDSHRNGRTITIAEVLDQATRALENQFSADPPLKAHLLATVGESYEGLGLYPEAIPLFEKARDLRVAALGADHPDTIASMRDLAVAYGRVGQFDAALPLAEKVLSVRKAKLRPDHPDVSSAMHDLAWAYRGAGRLRESVALFEETLKLQKAELGEDDTATLITMGNLAETYLRAGQVKDAIAMGEKTRDLFRTKLGPENHYTLVARNNLAMAYTDAKRFDEAIALHQETLKLLTAKLGPSHPDTLASEHNLAEAQNLAGRNGVSPSELTKYEEALQVQKTQLGPDHLDTLTAMNEQAQAYTRAGQLEKAVPLFEEVLKRRRSKQGPDHLDTLAAMHNLAFAFQRAGRLNDAVPLYEETVRQKKTVLGPNHPETLMSMNNLAHAYFEARRFAEGAPLLQEVIKQYKFRYGDDQAYVLVLLGMLATASTNVGRFDDAIAANQEILDRRKSKQGPDHPDTLGAMGNLASTYQQAGRSDEAMTLFDSTLKLMKAKLGPDHPQTLATMKTLAGAYERIARLDDAIALFQEYLKLCKRKWGSNQPQTLEASDVLGEAYRRANRLDEAASVYEESLGLRRARFGQDHAETRATMLALATVLLESGKLGEAETVQRELVRSQHAQLSADDPRLAGGLGQLVRILLREEKFAEAEPLARESLEIREKKLPDDWRTCHTRSLLGAALLGQHNYAAAEPLLLAGYEGMNQRADKIPEQSKRYVKDAILRLARFYEATDQPKKAAEWEAKIAPQGK